MGILNALSILGAGAARGYEGAKALNRQLAEARRKALLEEREVAARERTLALQESELPSIQSLREAQTGELTQQTGERKRRATRGQTRVLPEGQGLKIGLLGNELEFPGTIEDVTETEALLRELSGIKARQDRPELYGGTRRTPLTPEERKAKYILDTINAPTIVETPEELQQQLSGRIDFIKQLETFKKEQL